MKIICCVEFTHIPQMYFLHTNGVVMLATEPPLITSLVTLHCRVDYNNYPSLLLLSKLLISYVNNRQMKALPDCS